MTLQEAGTTKHKKLQRSILQKKKKGNAKSHVETAEQGTQNCQIKTINGMAKYCLTVVCKECEESMTTSGSLPDPKKPLPALAMPLKACW